MRDGSRTKLLQSSIVYAQREEKVKIVLVLESYEAPGFCPLSRVCCKSKARERKHLNNAIQLEGFQSGVSAEQLPVEVVVAQSVGPGGRENRTELGFCGTHICTVITPLYQLLYCYICGFPD